jgi:hypothetical protein
MNLIHVKHGPNKVHILVDVASDLHLMDALKGWLCVGS